MKLVYFAWLRERLGMGEETVHLPETVVTVVDLVTWLKQRDEAFAGVFEHSDIIQVAVDQTLVQDRSRTLEGVSEIAFFPPMTGG